eukprot:7697772-Alexandrium_andersonii.AAC.1
MPAARGAPRDPPSGLARIGVAVVRQGDGGVAPRRCPATAPGGGLRPLAGRLRLLLRGQSP